MKTNHHTFKKRLSVVFLSLLCIFGNSYIYAAPTSITIREIRSTYDSKNYAKTLSLTNEYLQSFPKDADAWLFQGYANYQLKNYVAAQNDFQNTLLISPNYTEAWIALSQLYYAQELFNKAMETVNFGLKYAPGNKGLLLKKAHIYYAENNLTEAINITEQLLKKYPEDLNIKQLLNALEAQQQAALDAAIKEAQQKEARTPAKEIISALVNSTVSQPLPNTIQMMPVQAPYFLTSKEPPATSVAQATTPVPEANTEFTTIKNLIAEKKLNLARNQAELYLQSNPNNLDVKFLLGMIYQQQQHLNLARKQFEAILKANAGYTDARVALIQTLFSLHDYKAAIEVATNGLSTKSIHQQMLSYIGDGMYTLSLESIKSLLAENKLNQAERVAVNYLKAYPTNLDINFYLGLIYQREEKWALAANQFQTILNIEPSYPEARHALIKTLFAMHNYQRAIEIAEEGLYNPQKRPQLLCDIATAQFAMNNFQDALNTLKTVPDFNNNVTANELYNEINIATNYRYTSYMQTGLSTSLIEVKNPNQAWTLSSVYAQYHTPKGTIGLAVNYQTRPNLDAPQFEIYALPQFTKNNYASLAYAHANNPTLFANQYIYAEDYQTLPYDFVISAGDTYRRLPLSYLNAYTASIAKYIGNYYIQVRPTYYVPSSGPTSLLYTLTAQKYFSAMEYIGFIISEGTAPDLADLNVVSFLKTDTQVYMLIAQHEINKQFALQYGIGEEIENFGNENLRRYLYLNFGLSFRDVQ